MATLVAGTGVLDMRTAINVLDEPVTFEQLLTINAEGTHQFWDLGPAGGLAVDLSFPMIGLGFTATFDQLQLHDLGNSELSPIEWTFTNIPLTVEWTFDFLTGNVNVLIPDLFQLSFNFENFDPENPLNGVTYGFLNGNTSFVPHVLRESDAITGSLHSDTLLGYAGNDTMDGGSGGDFLSGMAGNDVLSGADGDDTLTGAGGTDSMLGGIGDDSIFAGAGNDTLGGGDGGDRLDGVSENDVMDGGNGNDTLTGAGGNDSELGGAGEDSLLGGGNIDVLDGGAGNDTLDGGTGSDSLAGGAGDDNMSGGEGNDTLTGAGGRDLQTGGNGEDSIFGGAGNDTQSGDAGNDRLDGVTENDSMLGGDGNDTLTGAGGNDSEYGGAGADSLMGGANIDFLEGGAGNDTMDGGTGNDLFNYASTVFGSGDIVAAEVDVINGIAVGDRLDITDQMADQLKIGNFFLGNDTGDVAVGGTLGAGSTNIAFDNTSDLLMFDLDGNGTSDFQIQLVGVGSVTYVGDSSSTFAFTLG